MNAADAFAALVQSFIVSIPGLSHDQALAALKALESASVGIAIEPSDKATIALRAAEARISFAMGHARPPASCVETFYARFRLADDDVELKAITAAGLVRHLRGRGELALAAEVGRAVLDDLPRGLGWAPPATAAVVQILQQALAAPPRRSRPSPHYVHVDESALRALLPAIVVECPRIGLDAASDHLAGIEGIGRMMLADPTAFSASVAEARVAVADVVEGFGELSGAAEGLTSGEALGADPTRAPFLGLPEFERALRTRRRVLRRGTVAGRAGREIVLRRSLYTLSRDARLLLAERAVLRAAQSVLGAAYPEHWAQAVVAVLRAARAFPPVDVPGPRFLPWHLANVSGERDAALARALREAWALAVKGPWDPPDSATVDVDRAWDTIREAVAAIGEPGAWRWLELQADRAVRQALGRGEPV